MCQVPSPSPESMKTCSAPAQTWPLHWQEDPPRADPGPHFHISAHPLQSSNSFKEEAYFISGKRRSSHQLAFPLLSPGGRAEKIELWESSGRQLWFLLPAVTQLQRDRKVKESMQNRRLFTWLGGGDDQPLIKHRLPDVPLGLAC